MLEKRNLKKFNTKNIFDDLTQFIDYYIIKIKNY